ncbi:MULTISPECIES: deoxycytidine triphosphate deaminase [Acidiplasma]|jgi:dCTP deaminase|uniref:Deoxycytidine triphosphate deaminase n=1 Tax=Acidiplasma aeolicum TaxID=507754 RepID=A0A0P9ERD3_9ARCH|nr:MULTISPECIES: deoxycytidine triphosphate deaminase [Acidiplasma]KPV46286.1 deoxycytidine triphosphate deaminase [Acidiplasma aeolicum]
MLNDREILEYVKNGKLISENFKEASLTPNGYDLRVGNIIPGEDIESKTLFFISSLEVINMPDNITASLYIKSRYARKGIFGSFGFVDAGFHGNLTMSFINYGDKITIKKYDPVVQIVFFTIKEPEKNYEKRSGNFQNSHGIRLE